MTIAIQSFTLVEYSFPEETTKPHDIPDNLCVRKLIGFQAQASCGQGEPANSMIHLYPSVQNPPATPNFTQSANAFVFQKRAIIDRIDHVANVTSNSGPVNHAVCFNIWTSITGGSPNLARLFSQPLHAINNPSSANTWMENRRELLHRVEQGINIPMKLSDVLNLTIELPETPSPGGLSLFWNGMIWLWSER